MFKEMLVLWKCSKKNYIKPLQYKNPQWQQNNIIAFNGTSAIHFAPSAKRCIYTTAITFGEEFKLQKLRELQSKSQSNHLDLDGPVKKKLR